MSGSPTRHRGYLTREDMVLWAHVTRSVRPMDGRAAFALPEPLTLPATGPDAADSGRVRGPKPPPAAPAAAGPAPLQPLDRRQRQRLARGRHDVDGVIDLHGMRQAEAHGALLAFIHRAHREHRSILLVITGKGGGLAADGSERGVLKRMVPHWLADPVIRRQIVGFEEAARGHGGAGAFYVRIRKPKTPA
mgnify:CR=1 FL=1